MGFFDRIFGRKSRPARRWTAATNARLPSPGMIVLLDGPPQVNAAGVINALSKIEPLTVAPKWRDRLAEAATAGGVVYGTIEFDSHRIDVIGLDAPVPAQVVDRTLGASHWSGGGRAGMEAHVAHFVLNHAGGGANPLEKYIALYKVAVALGGANLAGVLIDAAWTCAPAAAVREFGKADFLKACREQMPPILFTGFVRFSDEEQTWYASKGQDVFGVPDFVMPGGSDTPSEALDLFMNIFLYVVGSARDLQAGHTMQIADEIFLRFGELEPDYPHREVLSGAGRTLTITRIGKDEVNQPEPDPGDV